MGANRQNVQRIVHDLARDGFVEFANNPHHRRAPLVMLTASGQNVHNRAVNLGAPWMNELARGIPPEDIEIMRRVLMALQTKLEKGVPAQQA